MKNNFYKITGISRNNKREYATKNKLFTAKNNFISE